MRNNPHLLFLLLLLTTTAVRAQNNTFSPYSRYGLGELVPNTFGHTQAMGGAHLAWRPDTTSPVFINAGNPASYSLIRLTALEVGGNGMYTQFKGSNSSLTKWTTNFAYASLGFPVRRNGGACFGIMPYSNVGYDLKTTSETTGVGLVEYQYNGSGGLNKAFIGYGISPFHRRLSKFRGRHLYVPDSLKTLSHSAYQRRELGNKLISELSAGFNVNYIFGNIQNITKVIYPNSLIYTNTYRERNLTVGDFTGNFGLQTAVSFDSVRDPAGKRLRIENEMKTLAATGFYSTDVLKYKRDSMEQFIPVRRRAIKEKVRFTFGYFMGLNNALQTRYNSSVYNYILGGDGTETIRDTALSADNLSNSIQLPLEQGFGIGFKKGERLHLVADFAITDWQNFRLLDNPASDLKNNYRVALGMNYLPNKEAAGVGAFWKMINYRVGVSYQTGYISINNVLVSDYALSAGLGLPVGIGRRSSMVHVGVQVGQMGGQGEGLIRQNYLRFNFGFTFCDRWFQKYLEN